MGIFLLYLFTFVCSCLQEERQLIKEAIESYATEKVDCILQSLDADAQALTRQFQHLQKRRAKYAETCFSRVLESFLREAEVALLYLAWSQLLNTIFIVTKIIIAIAVITIIMNASIDFRDIY